MTAHQETQHRARRRLRAALLLAVGSGLAYSAAWISGTLGHSALTGAFAGLGELLVFVALINAAAVLIFDAALPAARLRVPAIIVDVILAGAYAFALMAVLAEAGLKLENLVATSAVITAVAAFALQDTLGNLLGGMAMHFDRTLAPGDVVRLGADLGLVREIRWRHTTLETPDGSLLVVPNSSLMKSSFSIVGSAARPARWRRAVLFRVYYDRSPSAVIDAVESSLRADPPRHVASEPAPRVLLVELEGSAAVYQLRYWLSDLLSDDETDSEMRLRVYGALSRAGMKLSIPARAVVISEHGQDVLERSRDAETDRRLAVLRGVSLFSPLSEEELRLVAERLKRAPFLRGEALTRQGAKANWLYILEQGEAEVRVASADGRASQAVATLGSGDFMGEMGLMTGEPRAATVVALTDVDCYRLDREGFQEVLKRRPELAEEISRVLAERRVDLETARGGAHEKARALSLQKEQGDLLSRIRSFFELR